MGEHWYSSLLRVDWNLFNKFGIQIMFYAPYQFSQRPMDKLKNINKLLIKERMPFFLLFVVVVIRKEPISKMVSPELLLSLEYHGCLNKNSI